MRRTKSFLFPFLGLCATLSGCGTEPRTVYVDLDQASTAFTFVAAPPFDSPGLNALDSRPLSATVVPKSRPLTTGGISDELSAELSKELQEQLEQSRLLSERRLQAFLEKNYLAEARAGEATEMEKLSDPIARLWRDANAKTESAFRRYAQPIGKLRTQLANLVGSPDPRTNRARLRQPWVLTKPEDVQTIRDEIQRLELDFERERLAITSEAAAAIDSLIVDIRIGTALRVDEALKRARKESRDRLAAVSSFDLLLLNSESVAQLILGPDPGPAPISGAKLPSLPRLEAGQVKPSAVHLGTPSKVQVRAYVESWAALNGLKLSTEKRGNPDMTKEFLTWRQKFRTGL